MCAEQFKREVLSFENLLRSFEKLLNIGNRAFKSGNHTAHVICELYAMMSAFKITACMGFREWSCFASDWEEMENHSGTRPSIQDYEAVHKAAQELLAAVGAEDKPGISRALVNMGVLGLCPVPEHQLSRMKQVVERVEGRARLVPLVELSLFALELNDLDLAGECAAEARALKPSSWELYNVCVVEGLVALGRANVNEAVQQLAKAGSACQEDEYASLQCSVRPLNLLLVEKLLERGERVEVLSHLSDCKNVWQFLRGQIDEWMSIIERGEIPNFRASAGLSAMNELSYRFRMQWMSACSLREGSNHESPKRRMSPAEVLAGRERLQAEYELQRSLRIKRKLEYLEKELGTSPYQAPRDSQE